MLDAIINEFHFVCVHSSTSLMKRLNSPTKKKKLLGMSHQFVQRK